MRSDSKPQITLDNWLDTATRGLCADARERIDEEVTEHFFDAQSAYMNDGSTEDEAMEKALRELGNPRRARRRLRREHFTAVEAIYILGSINEELPKPSEWKTAATFSFPILGWFYLMSFIDEEVMMRSFGSPFDLLFPIVILATIAYIPYRLRLDLNLYLQVRHRQEIGPYEAKSRIRHTAVCGASFVVLGALILLFLQLPVEDPAFRYVVSTASVAFFAWGVLQFREWTRQIRIFDKRYAGKEAR